MKIAFWNVQGRDLSSELSDLIINEQIEILCLAEYTDKMVLKLLTIMNHRLPKRKFYEVANKKNKVKILTSFDRSIFIDYSSYYNSTRWSAHTISIPNKMKINLFCIHFHSKVTWSEISLALECANLSRDICLVEQKTLCDDTVIIGDFNMNPFEPGMVAANGLNAIQDLDYAVKSVSRVIDGTKYKFFYNPMWNYYGDYELPLGTHYFRTSGHASQEWNMFDQIIIRPSLKAYFKKNDINIITRIGSDDLTKSYNRPNNKNYSDHFPISINLTI